MTQQSTKTIARLVGGLSLGALVALTGCKSSGDAAPEDGGEEPAASQPAEGAESSCGGEGGCGGDGSCGGGK
jgi:hypothetical protein